MLTYRALNSAHIQRIISRCSLLFIDRYCEPNTVYIRRNKQRVVACFHAKRDFNVYIVCAALIACNNGL